MNDSADNNLIQLVFHESGVFRLVNNLFRTNRSIVVNHISRDFGDFKL